MKASEFMADAAKRFSEGEGALAETQGKDAGECRSRGHHAVMQIASLTDFVYQRLAAHAEATLGYFTATDIIGVLRMADNTGRIFTVWLVVGLTVVHPAHIGHGFKKHESMYARRACAMCPMHKCWTGKSRHF